MERQRPSITAFFPCYNDGGTIASMVTLTAQSIEPFTDDYEIIVIDDGSTDHSREVLQELAKRFDKLRLIFHERNRGYGGALRSGFYNATKDLIFYTDGDAQYDVNELPLLFNEMREGVDLVNGYKIGRSDPWYRIVIGRIYHNVVKLGFGLKVRDVDCDFRLMRRSIFNRINLESNSGVICLEFMKKVHDTGCTIREVPVHHFHRTYGKSQFFNFTRIRRVALGVARLWWKLVVWPKIARRPRPVAVPSVVMGEAGDD